MDDSAERPVLAVDLGGTQIRAALITPDRSVHLRRAEPTRDEDGVETVLERIVEVVGEVRDGIRAAGLPEPVGLGISSPGPLDAQRGIVLSPPNLSGWENVPIVDWLQRRIDLPATLERDTNAAVMGEWQYGAARDTRHAIYITVSTGIGGGIIADGRPFAGPDGLAGEIGHVVVDLDGPTCGCGGIGHAEAIASGTAIARSGRSLLDASRGPILRDLVAAGEPLDAALVARAADGGDAEAAALLERAWVAIGALCASLINLLNPEVIVIGGGIAEHRPRLFEVSRREARRRVLPVLAARIRIEPATLGGDVSLIGLLPIVNQRISDRANGAGSAASSVATA